MNKALAKVNGIIGIVEGVLFCLSLFLFWVVIIFEVNSSYVSDELSTASMLSLLLIGSVTFLMKVSLIILGIISLNKYIKSEMSQVPHILFIVAGGVGFIPIIGTLTASVTSFIGGILYLTNLKKIN